MCYVLYWVVFTAQKKLKIFKRTKTVLAEETNGFAVLTRTLIKSNVYV